MVRQSVLTPHLKMTWELIRWICSNWLWLEEEYGLEIPAEELADVETVGDVIEYLKSKGVED